MSKVTMSAELEKLANEAVFHLQYRTARAVRMLTETLGVSEDEARKAIATVAKPRKG
jgi:predicted metal-binding transcription factor (methanogenesis marker protein 9)